MPSVKITDENSFYRCYSLMKMPSIDIIGYFLERTFKIIFVRNLLLLTCGTTKGYLEQLSIKEYDNVVSSMDRVSLYSL